MSKDTPQPNFENSLPQDLLERLEILAPDLLSYCSIGDVTLRDILGQARLVEDKEDISHNVHYSLEAYPKQPIGAFRRIDIRYLIDMEGINRFIQDELQLMFHSEPQPWGNNPKNRTLFFSYAETDDISMRELYTHFMGSGEQYRVTQQHGLTPIPIQPFYRPDHPPVTHEASLVRNNDQRLLLSLAYQDFPIAGNEGVIAVPTAFMTPRARLQIYTDQIQRKQSNSEPFTP